MLLQLRVVLLTKPSTPDNPATTQLRPLSIASTVYRAWARLRARDVAARVELLALLPPSAEGFQPGRGAQQSTWAQQLLSDLARAEQHDGVFAAVQLDFSKFFDTIPWALVARLLSDLGIPRKFIAVLSASWKQFKRFYQVNSTPGTGSEAGRGYPQGCPLSPILSLVALLPLLRWISAKGIDAASFADDLSIAGFATRIYEVLPTIREYVNGLGMQLNSDKTIWLVAGTATDPYVTDLAALLAATKWGVIGGSCGRALGANLRVGGDAGDAWKQLQGSKESIFRLRVQRAQLVENPHIRALVVQSLTSALNFGAANEDGISSCTQSTIRLTINTLLATQPLSINA